MSKPRHAIELLEDAVNLLRSTPLSAVVAYLAGAIPFSLGLLFFLSDMTRSPFAADHLGWASLGLTALYVWKNAWQGVFATRLYGLLSPNDARSGSLLKLVAVQAAFQPLGLALMLPFPWVVAFLRNVALFAGLGVPDPVRTARRQATLWTRQNWGVLALVTLAGLLLFVNLLIAIALLPQFARSFLGIEGDFARAGVAILNLGTLAVAGALAWLIVDPLLDAVYVLRCFHGESLATGEDLLAALRRATATAVALMTLAVVLFVVAPRPALAQEAVRAPAVDPVALDGSIDNVIHQREFTWRAPRPAGEQPRGTWVGWVRSIEDMVSKLWAWTKDKIREWLQPKPEPGQGGGNPSVTPRMLELLIGVALALTIGIAIFLFRRRAPVVQAEAVTLATRAIDLADESLTADQLPEASWLNLADEWLAKGDCRMALRALYLAGLNYLGGRGLVSIQRWKSGLDYRRELERRAKAQPGIVPVFTRNVAIFESGWYGRHVVDPEIVRAFTAGLREMRSHAESA
jgi:hypothetical protein